MPADSVASPRSADRACVLITPAPDANLWHERVRQALASSDQPSEVLLTSDVDEALRFGAKNWTILMPRFDAGDDIALMNNRTRDVSRALAMAADAPGVVTIVDEALLSGAAPVELIPGTRFAVSERGASERPLAGVPDALAFYRTGRPVPGATAEWPLDLLHTAETSVRGFSSDLSFDMTGRGRILAWGPHITLSRGLWQMDLEFEVDKRGAKTILGIDWGSLSSHTRLEARAPAPGVHKATLQQSWSQAEIAELRVGLAHGAFSGHLRLRSLTVTFVSFS